MDFMKVLDKTVREMYVCVFLFFLLSFWHVSVDYSYVFFYCMIVFVYAKMQQEGGEFEGVEGSRDRTEGHRKFIELISAYISWIDHVWCYFLYLN